MTGEEKRRAATYVLRTLANLGRDKVWLQHSTGLDAGTVRTFLAGETFPQTAKRYAMEDALGVPRGTLELAARGVLEDAREERGDPVEVAINKSQLSRANKAKLVGHYYEMLDSESEGRRGA